MKQPDPTPTEITEACLQIQAGWTPEERLRRLRPDWRPSVLAADGGKLDMASEDYEEHHDARHALQEHG